MVELSLRLVLAGVIVFVGGWLGEPAFTAAWMIALVFIAYSVLGYRLEQRGLKNAGVGGLIACTDALCIALFVAYAGALDSLGFLVLAPCAYAAARYGSLPSAMAPLAAGSLLMAHSAASGHSTPSAMLLAQAAGVLLAGLLFTQKRIVVTVTRDAVGPTIEPLSPTEPDGFLAIRENFRRLKDLYRDLERRSRRDRLVVDLLCARFGIGERLEARLAKRIRELLGCEGLALFTMAQYAETLVVRATSGLVPEGLAVTSLPVDIESGAAPLKHRLEQTLLGLPSEGEPLKFANVLLSFKGKLIGLICLTDPNPEQLESSRLAAEEMSEFAAALIEELARDESLERRLRRTELLYEVAVTAAGAETHASVAARVLREFEAFIGADHLAIWLLEGDDSIPLTSRGRSIRILDEMSFAGGPGIAGWLRVGASELAVFDAHDDPRLSPTEAVKRRVGSFLLAPLQHGPEPIGYMTIASQGVGSLDLSELDALRLVAAELSQCFARMDFRGSEGLVTPGEMQALLNEADSGSLVVIEPLRREQIIEWVGKTAFDRACRHYASRLRGKLPAESALCRRDHGDFAVYLKGFDPERAAQWANDAAASASLIGLDSPERGAAIPFAVRAKVADLSAQDNQILQNSVA